LELPNGESILSEERAVRGKRRRLRACYILLAALVVLVSGYGLLRWRLKSQLQRRMDAIRAAGYPITCAELDKWQSIPEDVDNAAYMILDAISCYQKSTEAESLPVVGRGELLSRTEDFSEETGSRIAQFLGENSEALELLHEAASIEHSRYPVDYRVAMHIVLPELNEIKNCARLARLEAVWRAECNDAERALESMLSVFGVARSLAREPMVICQIVHIACHGNAVLAIERVINRTGLTDEQLVQLSGALISAEQGSDISRAFVSERCEVLSVFRNPEYLDSDNLGFEPPHIVALKVQQALGLLDKGAIVYLDLMSDYIETTRLPEHERKKAVEAIDVRAEATWVSSMPFTPLFARFITADLRRIAQLRTARAGLAIERYRLDNGKLPEKLAELVPAYLDAVPKDPFDGQELRYKRLEKGYVVYSIGRDLSDDGGAELLPPSKRTGGKESWDVTFIVER